MSKDKANATVRYIAEEHKLILHTGNFTLVLSGNRGDPRAYGQEFYLNCFDESLSFISLKKRGIPNRFIIDLPSDGKATIDILESEELSLRVFVLVEQKLITIGQLLEYFYLHHELKRYNELRQGVELREIKATTIS